MVIRAAAVAALILCLVPSRPAHARVFNYNDATIATYVRGTGGLASLGQDGFGNSSGTDTKINGETKFNYSGELGFMFNFTETVHLRLGAEVIQQHPVKEASGTNRTTGVERFTLESSVFVFNPNATVEVVYSSIGGVRFFGSGGVGMASVSMDNRYRMTAAGTTQLGGVTSFTEKLEGSALSAHLGLGLETHFVDNVTFLADFGYRYLNVDSLKYKSPVNNIVSPSGVAEGATALNHDGSKRQLNLSTIYVGVTFRFYMNFL